MKSRQDYDHTDYGRISHWKNASGTKDARKIQNGFQHAGEQVVLIYSDYEQTIKGLLDRQSGFVRNRYENNISDRRYNGRR